MKKLAIVGSHDVTRKLAPWDNLDYEIWVFNEAVITDWAVRHDASFQLHKPEVYSSMNNWVNPKYWPWLQEKHGSQVIYMQDRDDRVPNSRRYPLEEILESLPGAKFHWITSTASYALALALYLGYQDIEVYGIELTSNTEYSYQLNNWQYWTGVAVGMGINLKMVSGMLHFTGTLYGFEGEIQLPREYYSSRAEALDKLWNDSENRVRKAKNKVNDAILDRKYDSLRTLILDYQNANIESGQIAGAMSEANNYKDRHDPITRQEFERRAAQAQRDGEEKRVTMYAASGKTEYVYNVWSQSGHAEALRQFRQFVGDQVQLAYEVGAHHGIYKENLEYFQEYDARLTAAGGVRTLAALGVV